MQLCANKLDKKDFFGKSDPFLVFYRSNEDGTWVLALKGVFNGLPVTNEHHLNNVPLPGVMQHILLPRRFSARFVVLFLQRR